MKPVTIVVRVDNGDGYNMQGYMLTRCNKKYNIQRVSHSSCDSTIWDDEEHHTLELKDVIHIAHAKCDPRITDIQTTDKYLLEMYRLCLVYNIHTIEGIVVTF